MKPSTYLIIAAIGWGALHVLRSDSRPAWVDDLLIRAYGGDHVPMGDELPEEASAFTLVAQIAGPIGIPVLWLLQLRQMGVPDLNLPAAAIDIVQSVIAAGMPKQTDLQSLAAYKAAILDAVAARNGGHASRPV